MGACATESSLLLVASQAVCRSNTALSSRCLAFLEAFLRFALPREGFWVAQLVPLLERAKDACCEDVSGEGLCKRLSEIFLRARTMGATSSRV